MKTCLKCGAQFVDNAQFCNNCGFKDIQLCPEWVRDMLLDLRIN